MVNNQGIMHASGLQGGMPLCKNRNAHMSTTIDRFRVESKQCKRCAARVAKIDEKQRRKDERYYYTLPIGQNKPRIPCDVQSWDYAGTVGAVIRIWLPRKLTAWECEHYGLISAAPPAPEMTTPAPRVLVIHINDFNSQIIGGYLMINGKKASAMLTAGEIGASIIENPKQCVEIQRV